MGALDTSLGRLSGEVRCRLHHDRVKLRQELHPHLRFRSQPIRPTRREWPTATSPWAWRSRLSLARRGRSRPGRRAASATWGWRSTRERSASRRRSSTWPRRSTSRSRPTTARTTWSRSIRRPSSAAARCTIVHKEYFGFRDTWFGQFGRLLRSLQLTLEGPDPASPEGQKRIAEKGPASIRGLLNLIGRKLDLVAEYEDRVPAYVEQMFDRLEASGIIVGWDRDDWDIRTTSIGLDIRISPQGNEDEDEE